MGEMRARNLIGLQVIAQGGRSVGAVKDVLVDTDTWRVIALSVRMTKEASDDLKLRSSFWASPVIDIPVEEISGASDTLVLNRTLDKVDFLGKELGREHVTTKESSAQS
jgi:sporulation protein YlmC with PRC-barrel domain